MPEGSSVNYYNYEQMEKSVQEMSDELEKIDIFGAKKAYDMLRAKSFKSDMWRWMTMYTKGGIYLDAKFGFEIPVENWLSFKDDEYIECPCVRHSMNTGVLALSQYHPLALFVIKD
jgi:mannosyltransferase OCH1-like enzyme